MKRIGPELKMPSFKGGNVKVPPFLSDLYFDLRERRLLPIVGLILVAIVATPILLGGSSEPKATPPAPAPITGSNPAADTLAVVKAEPGLRNYKKRLAHRTPTNPFKQRFAGPTGLKEAELNAKSSTTSGSTETGSTGAETGTVEVEETVTSPSTGNGGGAGSGHLVFFAFGIDVKIKKTVTEPDGKKSSEEIERQRVLPPATLPSDKTQVVTYMGISPKTQKPLLLVSEEVTSVFGETHCLAGSGHCQLIEVEPKIPVTFVYGANDARYKIDIVNVEPVVTGHS